MSTPGCDSLVHLDLGYLDSGFFANPLLSADGSEWRVQRADSADTVLVGCAPMTVSFKDDSKLTASRLWDMGDSSDVITSDQGSHVYDSAGVYNFTFWAVSNNGCHDTVQRSQAVWVFEPPKASFTWQPEFPVMSHPEAQFHNTTLPEDVDEFTWLFQTDDGEDTVRERDPYFVWHSEGGNVWGDFAVTLRATQHNPGPYGLLYPCVDDTSSSVTIVNDWLQFPNLVTPNGDGVNDRWEVVNLLDCGLYAMSELWVFDAWGVQV